MQYCKNTKFIPHRKACKMTLGNNHEPVYKLYRQLKHTTEYPNYFFTL